MTDRHLLIAYWIEDDAAEWHSRRLGVSAYSLDDALALLAGAGYEVDPESATIREDVAVGELDRSHVVPNMGVVSRRGVWYPNVNGSP